MLHYFQGSDGTDIDHINWKALASGDQMIVAAGVRLFSIGDASTLFYFQGSNRAQIYGELVSTATTIFTNGSSSGRADIRVFDGGSITSATSYALDLTTGGSIYNAGVISGDTAVSLGGTGNRVVNDGDIVAATNGVSIAGSNNALTNTGMISADQNGVFIASLFASSRSTLNNSGTITANGLAATAFNGSGLVTVVNDGTIMASAPGGIGVDVLMNSSIFVRETRLDLDNRGTIVGDVTAVQAGDFADHLTNAGSIIGGILLGKGDDLYDGTGGSTDGTVAGEDGDDRLLGGGARDEFAGGAGEDELSGGGGDDVLDGGAGADALDGGDGRDTASYASHAVFGVDDGVTVDLDNPDLNNGDAAGDTFTSIERLVGTAGQDYLFGTSAKDALLGGAGVDFLSGRGGNDGLDGGEGDDTLDGGAGNDVLRGRAGVDTATYASATAGVAVDLAVAAAQDTGGAGRDRLVEIENLTGTAFADRLTGDDGANTLSGAAGNDVLAGGLGDDVLAGGEGDDRLAGGGGANDVADYRAAAAGVTVDLTLTVQQDTGGAGRDTISGVEHIYGSAYADALTGGSGVNVFVGAAGNDLLSGGDGNDILDAGDGNDTIDGGDGDDIFSGGAGNDVLTGGAGSDTAYYSDATEALVVDLALTVQQNTHGAGKDTLSGVENLVGSEFADTFRGNDAANRLQGGGGDDRLYGGGGNDRLVGDAGNDLLNGGAGNDTADYSTAQHAQFIDFTPASASALDLFDLSLDTFVNIEGAIGSAYNDLFVAGVNREKMTGGAGPDTFSFTAGNAEGDTITDFSGSGGDGDVLKLRGYGTGATFTQVDATHWRVESADHAVSELLTFTNAPTINVATDVSFGA